MNFREKVKFNPLDPPEPWERPYTRAAGEFFYEYRYAGHPFVPRAAEDVPGGALPELRDVCGIGSHAEVFVIPASVRFTSSAGRKVITPTQVLAIGPRAVALWAEGPTPGIAVSISLEELAYLEDIVILLYGRLSFFSAGSRLTIRYNTVARRWLEPSLLALRKRISGGSGALPRIREQPALPYKWDVILHSPFLDLGEGPPPAYHYCATAARNRKLPAKGQLLLLSAAELIYVRDSQDPLMFYGVDRFLLPRSRVESIRAESRALEATCNGADISLAMPQPLVETAVSWLA